MGLYATINKRKSCRDYTGQSFDGPKPATISDAINGFGFTLLVS